MSLIVSVVQEYISKLSSCLLSLQHDQHGAARQTLDTWNAEARALVCCVRAYNPKALKALETITLNEHDTRPAPGRQLFQQQLVRVHHTHLLFASLLKPAVFCCFNIGYRRMQSVLSMFTITLIS